jgi:hypothetical protein
MTIVLPLAVCLAGLLIYFATNPSTNPRLCEVGRLSFACGLLAFLLQAGPRVFSALH